MKKPIDRWTAKDFVELFYRELQRAYELPPGEYHTINFARDNMDMKNRVMSWFVEHGYSLEEVRNFIVWFFREQLPGQKTLSRVPHINWLPNAIIEYLARGRTMKKTTVEKVPESTFRREAYNNDLAYFGLAHKHGEEHKFSKWQYWLGFWWRRRNLTPEEMVEYRDRQRSALVARFDELEAGVHVYRFGQWEEEYLYRRRKMGRKDWNARMRTIFLLVQAKRRNWSRDRVREHYGLGGE